MRSARARTAPREVGAREARPCEVAPSSNARSRSTPRRSSPARSAPVRSRPAKLRPAPRPASTTRASRRGRFGGGRPRGVVGASSVGVESFSSAAWSFSRARGRRAALEMPGAAPPLFASARARSFAISAAAENLGGPPPSPLLGDEACRSRPRPRAHAPAPRPRRRPASPRPRPSPSPCLLSGRDVLGSRAAARASGSGGTAGRYCRGRAPAASARARAASSSRALAAHVLALRPSSGAADLRPRAPT